MNMRKLMIVLQGKTVYSMGGICNFAACNSKSLENTAYISLSPFSYEKIYCVYFPQVN